MSLAYNLTYRCPNHPKQTYRRYKHLPAPVCPHCGQPMEIVSEWQTGKSAKRKTATYKKNYKVCYVSGHKVTYLPE